MELPFLGPVVALPLVTTRPTVLGLIELDLGRLFADPAVGVAGEAGVTDRVPGVGPPTDGRDALRR